VATSSRSPGIPIAFHGYLRRRRPIGVGSSASKAIIDGRIAGVGLYYEYDSGGQATVAIQFSGLAVNYDQPALQQYGPTSASGTLVPVPEPEISILLGSGLLLLTIRTGRRRRA
jgi:hypothetical protein